MVVPVIERVSGAVISPITEYRQTKAGTLTQDSAVYCGNGLLCETSIHIASSPRHLNVPGPFPPLIDREVGGTHLYGGVLIGHFGHFLVEGLSRLWAVRQRPEVKSIVFVRGVGIGLRMSEGNYDVLLPRYVEELFDLLDVKVPIVVVHEPLRLEHLYVPAQLFGFHYKAGHPKFHSFVHRLQQFSTRIECPPSSIYISRSRLAETVTGGTLSETVLEDNLSRYGYYVFHPEESSLQDQIGIYNAAKRLIFAEGSAIHLFGFVARQSQKVAIVKRRHGNDFPVEQLRGFGRCEANDVNCIRNYYLNRNISTCELDFDKLGKELERLKFIPHRRFWHAPSKDELAQEADALGIDLRNN